MTVNFNCYFAKIGKNEMKPSKHELTNDVVVLKIMEQLQLQGKTEKELEQAIGLTTGAFARWKYLNGKSYKKYLNQIADFLDVTKEFLLDETDSVISIGNITLSELRLVHMYRKMDLKQRKCIFETAECFMYSKKYNNNEMETTKTGGEPSEEDENPLS